MLQVASSLNTVAQTYTPSNVPIDTVINPSLIIKTKRRNLSEDEIPRYFLPKTGKYQITSTSFAIPSCRVIVANSIPGLHRVFVDEENPYLVGCGRTLSNYGFDPAKGAVVIVRPDMCKFQESKLPLKYADLLSLDVAQISELKDVSSVEAFFKGCLIPV